MAKKKDEFLNTLLATFAAEADEHLNAISTGLLELEKAPPIARQKELIESIFREAHSLKGAARAVDLADVASVCQTLESVLAALQRDEIGASLPLFDLLQQTISVLERLISSPVAERTADARSLIDSSIQRLEEALSGSGAPDTRIGVRPEEPDPDARSPLPGTVRVSTSKLDSLFRQAEELIAAKLNAEQRGREFRVISANLADRTKTWDELHGRLRGVRVRSGVERQGNGRADDAYDTTELLQILDAEASAVRLLAERFGAVTAAAESDRRAFGKMIDSLLDDAKQLLMLPFSTTFEIIPRLVRDLARDGGKEADVVIRGTEIEIDRRIQEELKDPLIHLMRNCISHGIETPKQRIKKNKSPCGTICMEVSQKDTQWAEVVISDDGAGIDPLQVVSAAQQLGVVSPVEASALSGEEALALVFRSGVSTSSVVTDIAGRGLGLAIVKEKVEKLGGSIHLESQRDVGTIFRIMLPLTLAALRGVVVRAGDWPFVLPTANVSRVARIPNEVIKTVESRETVQLDGLALSMMRLSDVLGLPGTRSADKSDEFARIIVLVAGEERIACLVDEVLNEQEVLLKGLGNQLSRVRNIAGATVLGDGSIALVLNVPDLLKSGVSAAVPAAPEVKTETAETQGKSILVVEDSITARTLLRNILESSGYEVRVAVDGIDALTALKAGRFDLVVSDIEMPRMNGFDLTAKIRTDKKLAELPVVLVTALASREDRERGIDVGANAYIVKSGFDQRGLLEIIRRLI